MRQVVVVGGGLAGLTCAFELSERQRDVLLLEGREVIGGRTSSWVEDGMPVESGLHRWLGFYTRLPRLLERCDVELNGILCWEDEMEIMLPDGGASGVLGMAPLFKPVGTIAGLLGNNDLIAPSDKARLVAFFGHGLFDYVVNPQRLDEVTVRDYALRHGVSEDAIEHLLVPLTAGIFFLHPDRYSAFGFFGLLAPGIPRLYRMRMGAFMGGMTEVMCDPIAAAIEANGGEVRRKAQVTRLVASNGRITGVEVGGERIEADHVVVAASLAPAQELIRDAVGEHDWFDPMLSLPSMPAATIQLELDRPATALDRTSFGPGTVLGSFAEQSRTTFRHAPGRLSVILVPPERFLDMPREHVLEATVRDAARLGLELEGHVTDYRVVTLPMDFYSLTPGNDRKRPEQRTPVPGLTLAGDYTRQRLLASMEGAVISGQKAARVVLGND